MRKVRSNKIAKYSFLASAAIGMLNSCKDKVEDNDPNIEETDIDPDISLTVTSNADASISLDLNADNIADVSVSLYNSNYIYNGDTTDVNIGSLDGLNGAQILSQVEELDVNGTYIDTLVVSTRLSQGNTVDSSQETWVDMAYLAFSGIYYGNYASGGQFLGQDKYVGLSIQVAGNTHYAWMQLSMSEDGSNLVIKEYAYHTNPNTPIEAGAK